MGLEGVNEENILNFTKSLCESTNVMMHIWRNNKLPFLDEVLHLPYICERILEKESMINADNNGDGTQLTLMEFDS